MNIQRESKIEVAIHARELLEALKLRYPDEFMLNQFPADMKGVTFEVLTRGIQMTTVRAAQGPAEIDLNRVQRVIEDLTGPHGRPA